MKAFLIVSLASVLSAGATRAAEDSLNRRLTATPGGKLVIDVDFGAIEVSGQSGNEVVIEASRKVTLRGGDAEKEKAFLDERPITVTQEGDTVTIKARKPGKASGWNWVRGTKVEGKYLVKLPHQFAAALKTSGGGIQVDELVGDVHADTSGGGLRFTKIQGAIKGDTSGGPIKVSDCVGDLKVDTSGGGIDVSGGSGSLHADTSGGPITVRDFKGPAHVDTSGGGITLEKVDGAITASTSGGPIKAQLVAPLAGDVKLDTSGGGVTVAVAETAAFELDAATSGGGVKSDLAVVTAGKRQHDSLRGTVNGGGKLVKLRTSGGGIRVAKLGDQAVTR